MTVMAQARILPASLASIAEAGALLRRGRLVAFATETVYGLGADATDDAAVAGIFEAKGRPQFNPLIVHFASTAEAAQEVRFDARAERLADAFWPGPLTLVLPRREDCRISLLCSAGLPSLALRVPGLASARSLLQACGRPVAAPSANPSGRISPTRAEHVARALGAAVDLVLDDGSAGVGLESTVLDLSEPQAVLLRPGAVTGEQLEKIVGPLAKASEPDGAPRSPGQLKSHYAPSLPLRLEARSVAADEALLAFGSDAPGGAKATINLSADGDLVEAAGRLFAALHELDACGARRIAVMPVPDQGLGVAINDRLRRAAAPRPSDAQP